MEGEIKFPSRRYFRQRAHSNPYSDHCVDYPIDPKDFPWKDHFPNFSANPGEEELRVKFLDVGCGYGGLLTSLSPCFPEKLIMGLEIRGKVVEYVKKRIESLRKVGAQNNFNEAGSYQNITVHRMNAPKFMPNLFYKQQLEKMFFLFPDPHFKKKKYKHRVITPTLLSHYAYFIKDHGALYISTDVPKLFKWMVYCLDNHPLFERFSQSEFDNDICKNFLYSGTEESVKAKRKSFAIQAAAYHKIPIEMSQKVTNWIGFGELYTDNSDDEEESDSI